MFQLSATCNVKPTKKSCHIVFSRILNPRANLLIIYFSCTLCSIIRALYQWLTNRLGFFGCSWTCFLGLFTVTVYSDCIRFPQYRNMSWKDSVLLEMLNSGIMNFRGYGWLANIDYVKISLFAIFGLKISLTTFATQWYHWGTERKIKLYCVFFFFGQTIYLSLT